MKRIFQCLAFLLILSSLAFVYPPTLCAQDERALALMPLPAHIEQGEGQFLIDASFCV
jgi:hypothetical protein